MDRLRSIEHACGRIAGAAWFHGAALAVIVVAALIVGLETFPAVSERYGTLFDRLDQIILALFTIELLVRLGAYTTRPLTSSATRGTCSTSSSSLQREIERLRIRPDAALLAEPNPPVPSGGTEHR